MRSPSPIFRDMLLNLLSIVLLAVGASSAAVTPADMALSGKLGDPVTVAIINSAINAASVFVFPAHSYSSIFVDTPGWEYEDALSWDRYTLSTNSYIFKNRQNGYWLSVEQGSLCTRDFAGPTVFAVEPAGGDDLVIKLPYADSVFEAVYDDQDGYNPHPWYAWVCRRVILLSFWIHGLQVEVRPANGSSYQHWKIKTQPVEGV
ncbi:hypothetical protein C8R46DRAFT_463941 [Mycena filopes]|nr:hypothetical protein C8R46DRAFT_463941 [Mycena filopes]